MRKDILVIFILSLLLAPWQGHASVLLNKADGGAGKFRIAMSTGPWSLANGLVAYYSLDGKDTPWTSSTAATTMDRSGNNNTGTLTSMSQSLSPATGVAGQALNFDGVNDYVTASNSATGNLQSQISASLWLKTTVAADATRSIVRQDLHFTPLQLSLSAGAIGRCVTRRSGVGGNEPFTWNGVFNDGKWHHYVCTYDSVNGLKIYKDGALYDSNSSITGLLDTTSNPLCFGARCDGTVGEYTPITLDEIRFYNRELSAADVLVLYKMGMARIGVTPTNALTDGLVGHWTFDGGDTPWTSSTAATTRDKSGQSNTGTLTNMSQSISPLAGLIGQALVFDGVDDHVSISSGLLSSAIGTVSLWAKTTDSSTPARTMFSPGNGSDDNPHFVIQFVINSDSTCTVDNSVKFFIQDNAATAASNCTSIAMNDGKWHNYIGVASSGSQKLYVDGVEVSSTSVVLGAATFNKASVGSLNRTTNSQFFPGSIDDVRVYNRQLSSNEIKQLYTTGRR